MRVTLTTMQRCDSRQGCRSIDESVPVNHAEFPGGALQCCCKILGLLHHVAGGDSSFQQLAEITACRGTFSCRCMCKRVTKSVSKHVQQSTSSKIQAISAITYAARTAATPMGTHCSTPMGSIRRSIINLRVSVSMVQRCACAVGDFIFRCHQPAARFTRGACKMESDFAADILTVPLSFLDQKTLHVPRSTPNKALPSASALLVHATTSIIRAKQLSFLPDAPKGQVRPTRPTQHAALITSLTGWARSKSNY